MQSFVDEYRAGLAAFVDSRDEEARERACALGREAIRQGLGVLDISQIHSLAMQEEGVTTGALVSWQFFTEVLAPFEMALRGVRDANATLRKFNTLLEDRVTERTGELRATEKELRRQTAVLRGVLDSMADAVVVIDAQQRLALVNRSARELLDVSESTLGVSPEQWVTDLVAYQSDEKTLVPPDARPIMRALRGEVVRDVNMFIRREDADAGHHLRVSAAPLRDDEGKTSGAVIVLGDTTARRRAEEMARKAEERLVRAQKLDAVGQLAGGIAHDFNNILAVILSYATLLLEDLPADGPHAADVCEIRQAATSAATLTRQLLAFSRQQVLQPTSLDLNDVVTDLARMLHRTLGEHIELTTHLDPDLTSILADRGQVEQVLMNLAVNARDAMPSGGKLVIETSIEQTGGQGETEGRTSLAPGAYGVLAVTDTGTGMDAATKARIFEPFFTTKERGRGTGLGLATVYGIAQQSGGHVAVYSELGQGSTFRVYLPLAPASARGRLVPRLHEVARGTETLLVVEDEERVRAVTTRALSSQGYTVLAASGPVEARAIVHSHTGRIDLLLTDVVMPIVSGPELAKELTNERPKMRVLYMSGYAAAGITASGKLPPNAPFIEKPFTAASLRQRVRDVLDEREAP